MFQDQAFQGDAFQAGLGTPPWGWEVQPWQPPSAINVLQRRGAGLKQTVGKAFFNPWVNAGWQPELPSSLRIHPRHWRKSGGMVRSDDGNQSTFYFWRNFGWEMQASHLLPRFYPAGRTVPNSGDDGIEAVFIPPVVVTTPAWGFEEAAPAYRRPLRMVDAGDAGISASFVFWINSGWQFENPNQPPRLPSYRGAVAPKEDGTENPFILWFNAGWEIAPHQPQHPRPERAASFLRGDDGNESKFSAIPTPPFGYDPPPLIYRYTNQRVGGMLRGDDGNQATFQLFRPNGWEVAPPVIPRQRWELRGAVMPKEDGTENPFIFWRNFGWEVQSVQPGHPRPEKAASWLRGDDGNEATFVFVATTTPAWGWEAALPMPNQLPRRQAAVAIRQKSVFAIVANWINGGWEVQSVQPPHPKPERGASWLRGDDGNENTFTFVAAFTPPFGYDPPPVIYRYSTQRLAGQLRGDDGIQFPLIRFFPQGWDPTPPLLPRRRWEQWASLARGDDGTAAGFVRWLNAGWAVQDPQPPHPHPERSAAVLRGIDGIESPFVFVPPGFQSWMETPLPPPPHLRTEVRGAIMPRDDGTQFRFAVWFNAGWEVQPPPPPHFGVEKRAAAIMRGPDGTDSPFVLWRNFGWEIQPPPPPHTKFEKVAALLRGDDGTQGQLIQFFPHGWPIQPWQPPHPRPEKAGAIMFGDIGAYATFTFVPTVSIIATPNMLGTDQIPTLLGTDDNPQLSAQYAPILLTGTVTDN